MDKNHNNLDTSVSILQMRKLRLSKFHHPKSYNQGGMSSPKEPNQEPMPLAVKSFTHPLQLQVFCSLTLDCWRIFMF